jgi:hypothetical protein
MARLTAVGPTLLLFVPALLCQHSRAPATLGGGRVGGLHFAINGNVHAATAPLRLQENSTLVTNPAGSACGSTTTAERPARPLARLAAEDSREIRRDPASDPAARCTRRTAGSPSRLVPVGALATTLFCGLGVERTARAEVTASAREGGPVTLIELRQYTLRPGQRDVLIDLFEREFVESQEALGMKVVGTFRDLDRPNRFVWIRGFADMPSRAAGLTAFYGGPVWKAHRQAANATMIDSDDVFLLRVAGADSAFAPPSRPRAPRGAPPDAKGLVIATIYHIAPAASPEFVEFFRGAVQPALEAAGLGVRASYVSETSPNNFPALPVREKDHVFVWFATFGDMGEYDRALARLAGSTSWRAVDDALRGRLRAPAEILRLQPTSRSELRAGSDAGPSGADDFDFLIGDWTVLHRRLKRRLAGDTEWIEFTGPASVRKILAGLGNIDEFRIDLPQGGYMGATLRLFNPTTRQWSIHWMDSRDPKLDPPVVGSFQDGRGLFFGDDTFEGKPVRVRFIWSPLTATTWQWEQAFSPDGGKTWETNWTMSFTRIRG